MKLLMIIFILIFTACQNSQSSEKNETVDTTNKSSQVQTKSNQEIKTVNNDLVAVKDTGQTWFRVNITKNDSAYLDFEGSWPVFFFHGNSGTLQMPKAKGLMTISPGISIYMNGMPSGKAPVVLSNREKGTVSMIFMPVIDGAYGLAVSATDGFFDITKNVDSVVNGNFEAKAVDLDKNNYLFKGYFINTKINPEKY